MKSCWLVLAAYFLFPYSYASYVSSLPQNAQQMFNESMMWMDNYYDPEAGYLYDVSATTALHHETRSSAWYALGLLARNQGEDIQHAEKIVTNVINGQFKDPAQQWFGTYQKYPEEPAVGSPAYEQQIYNSWDPNWRGFIGTTFIMMLEEFGQLLSHECIELIEASLYNASVGDSYRVGGVDDDNLYPAYSNPSIMRAFTSTYVGLRLDDANMTAAGEEDAQNIIDLFNRANTLSEFNSGTYTGVSLYALTLWAKYLPESSIMKQRGPDMIQSTWKAVGEFWHADLKNIAGPWDRVYGFDMNRYFSLMALWFWVLVDKQGAGLIRKPQVLSHSADFSYAPLFAVLAGFHQALVPAEVMPKLRNFPGEHLFESSAFSPPYDTYPRNITAWLGQRISIGAESFNETVIGGPARNPSQFTPAVVQWDTGDGGIGFVSLYATEPALQTVVSPYRMALSYPHSNSSSIFSLLVSTFKNQPTVSSWADLVGISVNITGNIDLNYTLSFAGKNGGEDEVINDFEFWNFTYSIPAGLTEPPSLVLELELQRQK